MGIKDGVTTLRVAALTILSKGAQITNVSVSGTLTTNYAGELPRLNEVFFEEDSNGVTDIAGFTANVTIQVQN
jgi:hypothetical protein